MDNWNGPPTVGDNWNAFESAQPDDIIAQEGLGEPTKERQLSELDLRQRRLKTCVEKWPEAEIFLYDPRCCRWPKNCSPYGQMEAVEAGNLKDEDLEPPHDRNR